MDFFRVPVYYERKESEGNCSAYGFAFAAKSIRKHVVCRERGIAMGKNIFIEGLQGTGKSTLINRLAQQYPCYQVYREGDLSPVELAWCSYLARNEWEEMLQRYPGFEKEIRDRTRVEENRYIVAYTRILTESRTFYEDMEKHEIYNGRVDFQTFHDVIMKRYRMFSGENQLFECSFFQNSIECMMLYYQMSEEDIFAFYEEAYGILKEKGFGMLYLDSPKIRENLVWIKRERSDGDGNEMWYPLMLQYLKESPYGKAHGYKGLEDMVEHFMRRRQLEKKIIGEVLKADCLILEAKKFEIDSAPVSEFLIG